MWTFLGGSGVIPAQLQLQPCPPAPPNSSGFANPCLTHTQGFASVLLSMGDIFKRLRWKHLIAKPHWFSVKIAHLGASDKHLKTLWKAEPNRIKAKEHRGNPGMESSVLGPQGWWQGQRATCASAEDEGHLLVPSCQVNPHLGIPTALPQSPNPHGDRVPSAHDTRHFVYPASDSRNSLEPELLQENHRFKAFRD